MHQISNGAGTVVAAETQASVAALDTALISQGKLCASVLEAAALSKMPMVATQKLIEAITAGMSGLAAGRSELAAAVRELTVIQSRSNLRETSFGCLDGLPPMNMQDKQPETTANATTRV